jgi:hypothetical protein
MAGYKDFGFHLRASLKGQGGILVFSLMFAAVTILVV